MSGAETVTVQTQIAVTCTGENAVPVRTIGELCESFQAALTEKYPNAGFAMAEATLDHAAAVVTLETFVANTTTLEARLSWQLNGANRAFGPRMGFSVTDLTITPQMYRKFLTRLINDTRLPF